MQALTEAEVGHIGMQDRQRPPAPCPMQAAATGYELPAQWPALFLILNPTLLLFADDSLSASATHSIMKSALAELCLRLFDGGLTALGPPEAGLELGHKLLDPLHAKCEEQTCDLV